MDYFITTKTPNMTVEGRAAFSASEALEFIESAKGSALVVEVRDQNDELVTEDQLRRAARLP